MEAVTPVAESAVNAEGSSPSRVPVGDQVTPVTVPGGELGPPFSMPKFEPTQDHAQARQDDLKHQIEMYRIDADTKVRLRQLELQAAQDPPKQAIFETSISLGGGSETAAGSLNSNTVTSNSIPAGNESVVAPSTHFDVAKNIEIVPPFHEKEIEAYFQAFERIVTALKWPTEVWALMLQCKLTGKAQVVCASLSLEESVQYDAVKIAVLQAYELIPEHYRQRFRTTKKSASQTYVEFAREKCILFDRWIKACKVKDYNSLRELMLIEEFKNCVPECTALYLNEQKVSTVQQAAVLADEYTLLHKTVLAKRASDTGGSLEKENESLPDCSVLVKTSPSPFSVSTPDPCFQPFVFDGFVSLNDGVKGRKLVRILRDTGGSQSFVLSKILDFCADSACEASTIVQGIEMGFVTIPLHRVWVTSELASGCFEVAVRDSLPVKVVDFIMGNDIAGGKVMPVVQVTNAPCIEMHSDALAETLPEVFSSSAITTRAQTKRDSQENNNLNDSIFCDILGNYSFPNSGEVVKLNSTSPVCFDLVTDMSISREALIDANHLNAFWWIVAYHPETQGALERWHQTLKSALRKYCIETGSEWDDGVPFVLFAVREA
ncbi:hypothetical protein H4Q32_028512 [Labeo rohita]|uniref:SCAN box domain-containing protein n=1 Tax=Labeo rohita TaxID=84645 RepID=A0ABQ8L183_LABRO|nr:hypothetical protein H4Q32_028512 [Labeo rohita]